MVQLPSEAVQRVVSDRRRHPTLADHPSRLAGCCVKRLHAGVLSQLLPPNRFQAKLQQLLFST